MQQPSLVFSQRQWPQQNETLQQGTPFQVQQQEQVPSQRAWQRLCSVAAETWSGQRQLILQPVLVFSNDSSHRGTTQTCRPERRQAWGSGPVLWQRLPAWNVRSRQRWTFATLLLKEGSPLWPGHRGWARRTRIEHTALPLSSPVSRRFP